MRDNYETFRRSISTCEEIVLARFGIDLSSVLNTQSSSSILTKEQQGFLSEYITFSIWETLGMEPTLCIGEGIGQLGAAVAAGLIDLNFAIDYLQNPATFSPPKTSHVAQRAYFSVWTNTFVHPGEVLDSSSWQLEQLQHDQAPRNCSFPPEIEAMLRIRLATGCLDNHSFCTNKYPLFNLSIEQLLLGLIQTSTADVSPHLELVGGYRNCTVVTLPPYPFERQTFTILGSRSSQPGCVDRRDTLNQGRSSSNQLSSDIEDQLCRIWTAMFGRSDFSPTDDFFLEGGDSCNVEQLRQDIHAAFGYPISAREIHSHPTIAAQVTLLRCAIQSGEIEFKAQSMLSRSDIISKPSSRLRYEEEITLEERSSFRNDREVSAALGFNREISSRIATLSALESQLHVMWAHVLGHNQFGITDNFFQVGGHSLAAAQLATAMESSISRRITTADLFCVPTIREQADWLRNPEPGLLRNLVTLQPGGDRPPIYGIHGWGGTIGHFVELGKTLGPCRSFFGLQANDNGGDFELQDQQDLLRNMAANYADQILERHVGGPIHLLGYSVGGWYAHAVADALLQRGAPIGLFAVLDTHPIPVIDRQLGLRLLRRKLKERVGSKREASINMFSQEDKLLLANRLRRLRRDLYLYMGIKLWLPTKVMATLKGHRLPHTKNDFFVDLLIRQYRPTKLPIKADVFAPSTELKFLGPLWASYCCGGARLNPLFDYHSDFINEKRAGELAEALELALARVENNV
jgi:pimeloyl-ACP methyl ester carboxylesterase